jgi:hypothetical protein
MAQSGIRDSFARLQDAPAHRIRSSGRRLTIGDDDVEQFYAPGVHEWCDEAHRAAVGGGK